MNRGRPAARRGLSLPELLVSTVSASLLVAGITSSIFLASRAAETDNAAGYTLDAGRLLDDLAAELQTALYFKARSSNTVKFVVSDQDGDGAADTIRYAWSGTAGDPLTRQFNSQSATNIAEDVQQFSLTYLAQATSETPRILLVAGDAASPSSQDAAKRDLLESWGYEVDLIDDGASQSEFDEAISKTQVAYISEEASATSTGTKLLEASLGIVNEEGRLNDSGILIASSMGGDDTYSQINITNNTHYITSPFSTGTRTIASSSPVNNMRRVDGTLASGATTLATRAFVTVPTLVIIDYNGVLYGGGSAAGRRVAVPWGGSSFNIATLNADGQTLMQRSLDWAAGDFELTRISVALQIGSADALVESDVELLNRTRVAAP